MFFIVATEQWQANHCDLHFVPLDHPTVQAKVPLMEAEKKMLGASGLRMCVVDASGQEMSRLAIVKGPDSKLKLRRAEAICIGEVKMTGELRIPPEYSENENGNVLTAKI